MPMADSVCQIGVSELTSYMRRKQYGGMSRVQRRQSICQILSSCKIIFIQPLGRLCRRADSLNLESHAKARSNVNNLTMPLQVVAVQLRCADHSVHGRGAVASALEAGEEP